MWDVVFMKTSNTNTLVQWFWPAVLQQRLLWNSAFFCSVILKYCTQWISQTHTQLSGEKRKKSSAELPWVCRTRKENQVQGFVKVLKYIWTMVFTWDLTGTWSRFIREINVSCPVEGNWAFSCKIQGRTRSCVSIISPKTCPEIH